MQHVMGIFEGISQKLRVKIEVRVGIWVLNQKYGKSPKIIHFYRVFHYKPSIWRYPYFWKHSYNDL